MEQSWPLAGTVGFLSGLARLSVASKAISISIYFPFPLPSSPCMYSVHGEARGQCQVSSFTFPPYCLRQDLSSNPETSLSLNPEHAFFSQSSWLASSGDPPASGPLLQQHWGGTCPLSGVRIQTPLTPACTAIPTEPSPQLQPRHSQDKCSSTGWAAPAHLEAHMGAGGALPLAWLASARERAL